MLGASAADYQYIVIQHTLSSSSSEPGSGAGSAQGENPDMVTDLWDCSLVSTWTLHKTLEQRPCVCEDGAVPRAVGTWSHRGVPRTPKEAKP